MCNFFRMFGKCIFTDKFINNKISILSNFWGVQNTKRCPPFYVTSIFENMSVISSLNMEEVDLQMRTVFYIIINFYKLLLNAVKALCTNFLWTV